LQDRLVKELRLAGACLWPNRTPSLALTLQYDKVIFILEPTD
jgi:hypothetical protein